MTEPSICRQALDMLLARYPNHDLLSLDWQHDPPMPGPWLIVELGMPIGNDIVLWKKFTFVIWKRTGSVYELDENGAVFDDPLLTL
jgi:hypothetical protein